MAAEITTITNERGGLSVLGNAVTIERDAKTPEKKISKHEMRAAYALQGLLVASTAMATLYNPQHVVLGTDGTVVVGAGPSLYFRTAKNQIYRGHDQLESEEPSRLVEFDTELHNLKQAEAETNLPLAALPARPMVGCSAALPIIHDELLAVDDLDTSVEVTQM
ncbi:unnamed protein product [Phytophthora fragariaefolia]|uniref:Unnamed protein product n=1 Tax=Phytophthora fragariaefolia TaxID=1490495 RepID=A0A9W7CWC2_9STRA|nr:unnamed protein product [Phytophthora fragariaefolia]